ncbi:MAG: hypothetical protein WEG56_10560 [Chloroflexota bacterium]
MTLPATFVVAADPVPERPGVGTRVVIGDAERPDIDGIREPRRVDISSLPPATDREAAPERPRLRLVAPEGSPAATPNAGGPRSLAAVPPAPDLATTSVDATAAEPTAFAGLQDTSGVEPPDPWIAVGPDHVIQAVNTTFRISDRAGNALETVPMFDFFGLSAIDPGNYDAEVFDPRVIFDRLQNRWVAIETSFDCYPSTDASIGTGYVDAAISATADPTGEWSVISIAYPDFVPDYPGIGTSTDKVVVSANVFPIVAGGGAFGCDVSDPFQGTEMYVMAWSELKGTGDVSVDYFFSPTTFPASYSTWRPALQTPATSATVHVIGRDLTDDGVVYAQITGSPAGGGVTSISAVTDLTAAGIVPAFGAPPQPAQPGVPATIDDAVDGRPTDALWQNGRLALVSTYPCDPAGGAVETRDCVRVTQLNTASSPPSRRQDFLVSRDGRDVYMGGIGYAGNGDLHVVWTQSSATAGDYASSHAAYQRVAASPGTLSVSDPTALGTGTYPGTRWGDYVGVAQDPQVPNAVWQANQYALPNGWATNVSQLQTSGSTYVPITPIRILDSRSALGVSGIFVASQPRSFTVANFGGGVIPADAIAVTGNVTVTAQTAAGYVSITTTATSTPGSSTLNFPLSDTRANNVTASLASDGQLSAVYKAAAGKKAHIIFDVTGYFLPGLEDAGYNPMTPVRILDSRTGIAKGLSGRFFSGVPRQLAVAGTNGIPAGAVAITANLTIVGQTSAGYVSVMTENDSTPATSNLNVPKGDIRANGLTARLASGKLWLVFKGSAGSKADLILDVTGYYLPAAGGGGLQFFPLDPGRLMDTRTSVLSGLTGKFTSGAPRTLDADGHWGIPAGAHAVTGNLTVVGQSGAGYASITSTPISAPTTSTINFPLGDTRANGVTVPLTAGAMSMVYKSSAGKTTHLILDVTGYFE